MVASLLDTSIIVDLLRNYKPAEVWIKQQSDAAVSAIVWIEVLNGAQNRRDQQKAIKLLQDFGRIDLVSIDYDWAIAQTVRFKLSHNIGANDCLIAAVSNRLQVPLFTRNLKHFAPMLGALAQKPY